MKKRHYKSPDQHKTACGRRDLSIVEWSLNRDLVTCIKCQNRLKLAKFVNSLRPKLAMSEQSYPEWKGSRWCEQPVVTVSHKKTMHWKVYDKGTAFIEFRAEHGNRLSIDASESPDSGRGGKRVMIDLERGDMEKLRDLLNLLLK